jgi:GH25 family lysozyme M1 (1,4-beta-N-acetylmuramidase)
MDRSLYFADISSNRNGANIDVNAYWNAGHRWLFCKATEGTGYRWFERDAVIDRFHAKGGHVGHYHWLRPEVDAAAQADFFLAAIKGRVKPGDKLMADVEASTNYSTGRPAPDGTDAQLAARVRAFCNRVQAAYPDNEVIIYTGNWYVDRFGPALIAELKRWRLILSQYNGANTPANPHGFRVAAYQFTDAASIAGLSMTGDYNRWLSNPNPPAPKPTPATPNIPGKPVTPPKPAPKPKPRPKPKPAGRLLYVIKSGDTLTKIAAEHHISLQRLYQLNRLRHPFLRQNANRLSVGWKVRVR